MTQYNKTIQPKGRLPKQNKSFAIIFSSPMGPIGITLYNDQLSGLEFLVGGEKYFTESNKKSSFVHQLLDELAHYFENAKHHFTIRLHVEGTPFQKRVWKTLQSIPSGTTLTYGALAKKLQTSPRAIGQACRTNRIPIIIPCHRVIAAHHVGGYAGNMTGSFAKIKEQLLRHELNHMKLK